MADLLQNKTGSEHGEEPEGASLPCSRRLRPLPDASLVPLWKGCGSCRKRPPVRGRDGVTLAFLTTVCVLGAQRPRASGCGRGPSVRDSLGPGQDICPSPICPTSTQP